MGILGQTLSPSAVRCHDLCFLMRNDWFAKGKCILLEVCSWIAYEWEAPWITLSISVVFFPFIFVFFCFLPFCLNCSKAAIMHIQLSIFTSFSLHISILKLPSDFLFIFPFSSFSQRSKAQCTQKIRKRKRCHCFLLHCAVLICVKSHDWTKGIHPRHQIWNNNAGWSIQNVKICRFKTKRNDKTEKRARGGDGARWRMKEKIPFSCCHIYYVRLIDAWLLRIRIRLPLCMHTHFWSH